MIPEQYLLVEARLGKEMAKTITDYIENCRHVAAAYLFGSYARGTDREQSDIDLAVLFTGVDDQLSRFDYRLDLIIDLERISGQKIDVIDIKAAPLLLQHYILKDGILLVDKNPGYRIAFETESRRAYFDFQPYLERRNRKLIAKIMESGLNG